ncbi:MAG: hypothetical protein B7X11_01225 [Acidobacteria bacterium 37-65-4]|nr:MAG: hypothetical protein B7X11_01225 [Acidobacteria bacterium 37-65-4]
MTLDREQWIHLATANAAIIRADLDHLRNVLTEGPQVGYAEFWAQARDIAAKFKTFKPIEAEAREVLWSDYRAICEATRALQESERGQSTEESKTKRARIEAELARAAELVDAAQTPQELSRAQSLLDQILNQMKTQPTKEPAPRRKSAPSSPPRTKEEQEPISPPAAELSASSAAAEGQPAAGPSAETAETVGNTAEVQHETPMADAVSEAEEQPAPPASSAILVVESAVQDEPQGVQEVALMDAEPTAQPEESLAGGASLRGAAHDGGDAPTLLRSDREACWTRWTQIRDILKAKRAEHRKRLLDSALGRAREIVASLETLDPRAVQEAIRVAQADLKSSGLSLAEQETVRTTLRSAWKACSDRIEFLRQERQKTHGEWLERMTTHLSRWETQVLKNQATAVQIQGEVADLESQAASTGDEGRSSKLRQWINAKNARMAGLEASTKELAQKIQTVRAKMGKEAPPPITELSEEDLAAASRPSPSADRRPRPDREAAGSSRGPRRAPREERPSEPQSHPGLNLGDLLAKHLGLTMGGRGVAEVAVDEVQEAEPVSPIQADPIAEAEVKEAKAEDTQAEG